MPRAIFYCCLLAWFRPINAGLASALPSFWFGDNMVRDLLASSPGSQGFLTRRSSLDILPDPVQLPNSSEPKALQDIEEQLSSSVRSIAETQAVAQTSSGTAVLAARKAASRKQTGSAREQGREVSKEMQRLRMLEQDVSMKLNTVMKHAAIGNLQKEQAQRHQKELLERRKALQAEMRLLEARERAAEMKRSRIAVADL
mmetsp:Transcript_27276/g.62832  ORF Transcript_27276/g.62832 Transcript_27276/m.62832 type:complete len:200 (+) Transcript_27276:85-684(+)